MYIDIDIDISVDVDIDVVVFNEWFLVMTGF